MKYSQGKYGNRTIHFQGLIFHASDLKLQYSFYICNKDKANNKPAYVLVHKVTICYSINAEILSENQRSNSNKHKMLKDSRMCALIDARAVRSCQQVMIQHFSAAASSDLVVDSGDNTTTTQELKYFSESTS